MKTTTPYVVAMTRDVTLWSDGRTYHHEPQPLNPPRSEIHWWWNLIHTPDEMY